MLTTPQYKALTLILALSLLIHLFHSTLCTSQPLTTPLAPTLPIVPTNLFTLAPQQSSDGTQAIINSINTPSPSTVSTTSAATTDNQQPKSQDDNSNQFNVAQASNTPPNPTTPTSLASPPYLNTPTNQANSPTQVPSLTQSTSTLSTVAMEQVSLIVPLHSPTAQVKVQRLGSASGAIAVNYTTHQLSAHVGVDYRNTEGILSWDTGDGSDKLIVIQLLPTADQQQKQFYASLSGPINTQIGIPSYTIVYLNAPTAPVYNGTDALVDQTQPTQTTVEFAQPAAIPTTFMSSTATDQSIVAINDNSQSSNQSLNDSANNTAVMNNTDSSPNFTQTLTDDPVECYTALDQADYRGNYNISSQGLTCYSWSHYNDSDSVAAAATMNSNDNACRNVNGAATVWCHTIQGIQNCSLAHRQSLCSHTVNQAATLNDNSNLKLLLGLTLGLVGGSVLLLCVAALCVANRRQRVKAESVATSINNHSSCHSSAIPTLPQLTPSRSPRLPSTSQLHCLYDYKTQRFASPLKHVNFWMQQETEAVTADSGEKLHTQLDSDAHTKQTTTSAATASGWVPNALYSPSSTEHQTVAETTALAVESTELNTHRSNTATASEPYIEVQIPDRAAEQVETNNPTHAEHKPKKQD